MQKRARTRCLAEDKYDFLSAPKQNELFQADVVLKTQINIYHLITKQQWSFVPVFRRCEKPFAVCNTHMSSVTSYICGYQSTPQKLKR